MSTVPCQCLCHPCLYGCSCVKIHCQSLVSVSLCQCYCVCTTMSESLMLVSLCQCYSWWHNTSRSLYQCDISVNVTVSESMISVSLCQCHLSGSQKHHNCSSWQYLMTSGDGHSFVQRPVHPSFGRVNPLWMGVGGIQNKEQNKVFRNPRSCQLCLDNEYELTSTYPPKNVTGKNVCTA